MRGFGMPYGYNGKILRVDLAHGKTWVEEPNAMTYRSYLGGGALACYYFLKELKPGTDPLGPDNILIFMTSVINGTPLSGLNRFSVAAKSPLTGGYGESEAGGWWAPELKSAGFDGIIVHGKASVPAYLWVHDGEAELRDARAVWGKLSGEVQTTIREELGDNRIRVIQTGVAGENLVRYAAIVNELKHFNGRCGLGAVMGSKNLKAIAVRGSKRRELFDRESARDVIRWLKESCDLGPGSLHDLGTSRAVLRLDEQGILPTRNFKDGSFEHAEGISGTAMRDRILVGRGTCYGCILACKREVRVDEYDVDPKYGGPEYETIAANGSLCGIADLKIIAKANQLLAEYVLDSISTGATIAFAMECYENRILTKEDTGGIELEFGNGEALLKLIQMIGRREGIGDLLAEGVKRAAQRIGKGAHKYALHVKGQELPMHDPRGKRSLALAYSVSPTGADHAESPHDSWFECLDAERDTALSPLGLLEPVDRFDLSSKKVRAFLYGQMIWSLYNSIGVCIFVGAPDGPLSLSKLVEYVRAVTGWDTSLWELLKVGEKANTMSRIFNYREGFTKEQDTLPDRMFEGLEGGPMTGEKLDRERFQRALETYYQMAGWDPQTGAPTKAKLAELGLEWAAAEG